MPLKPLPRRRQSVNNIRSTLATVWRIAAPYFRSEDKLAGRGLLAAVIAIELALVALDVLLNQWNNRFYNALQEKNWDVFVREIGFFCVLATSNVVLSIYQLYLNQWLQIRWRRWMTTRYLGEWLQDANHYRMQLQGDAADNPDQRITDDVKLFVERTLDISVGLLSSVVTLVSFVIILWGLSAAAPLTVFGSEFAIPGYLVWGALIYAIFGTALTQWIGSPLVRLDFQQQRVTGSSNGHKEITAIAVERGTPGYTQAPKYRKLGWHASDTRELIFDDVRVPLSNLVGEEGAGYRQFLQILESGRVAIAALAVGVAQACLDAALAYSAQRR